MVESLHEGVLRRKGNNKLLGTSASLLVTSALLLVTMFAIRNKCHASIITRIRECRNKIRSLYGGRLEKGPVTRNGPEDRGPRDEERVRHRS